MIVEFGYYDYFGKLAPICATKIRYLIQVL